MVTHRFADEASIDNMAVVYVSPKYWGEMNVDQETVFAGWAALCQRSTDMISSNRLHVVTNHTPAGIDAAA